MIVKEKQLEITEYRNKIFIPAMLLYGISFIFVWIGLHKILVYVPSDEVAYGEATKNFIVQGDAYNYIINGTHATVFMLLALIITIIASTLLIYMNQKYPIKHQLN